MTLVSPVFLKLAMLVLPIIPVIATPASPFIPVKGDTSVANYLVSPFILLMVTQVLPKIVKVSVIYPTNSNIPFCVEIYHEW